MVGLGQGGRGLIQVLKKTGAVSNPCEMKRKIHIPVMQSHMSASFRRSVVGVGT